MIKMCLVISAHLRIDGYLPVAMKTGDFLAIYIKTAYQAYYLA
jgi:hypothetical protein